METVLHFNSPHDLLKAVLEMFSECRDLDKGQWDECQAQCRNVQPLPPWFPYLKASTSPFWDAFSLDERHRAADALKRYFVAVVDAPSLDVNQLFFRAYEQQGSNFLGELLPEYKRQLGVYSWAGLVAALASLLDGVEQEKGAYDRAKSGGLRRSFFRGVKVRVGGPELVAALKMYPPRGRSGWQLLWQMMRGCAALGEWDYDFGKALREKGVIEFLEHPDG
jgi:hypothetical protein